MADGYVPVVLNPESGRYIQVGGQRYRELVLKGVITPHSGQAESDAAAEVPGVVLPSRGNSRYASSSTPDHLRQAWAIPEGASTAEIEFFRREVENDLPEGYSAVLGRGIWKGSIVARKRAKTDKKVAAPIGAGVAERAEAGDWLADMISNAFSLKEDNVATTADDGEYSYYTDEESA